MLPVLLSPSIATGRVFGFRSRKSHQLSSQRLLIFLKGLAVMGVAEVEVPKRNPSSSLNVLALQNVRQGSTTSATEASSKPKKKICCACPDTKRLRDECIVEHGEAACTKWIEAHLQCLRSEGFKV